MGCGLFLWGAEQRVTIDPYGILEKQHSTSLFLARVSSTHSENGGKSQSDAQFIFSWIISYDLPLISFLNSNLILVFLSSCNSSIPVGLYIYVYR